MQILHVSSFAPPHLGGLETCAEGLFRELAELGLSVRWLFSNVPRIDAVKNTIRIDVWNRVEERFGIPIPIPKPTAIRAIWDSVRSADLVHVHDVMYFTSFWAVLFAKLLRKRVVVTLHIWKVPYESAMVRALQQIAHCFLGRVCLRSASAVVTYNRSIFDLARRHLDEGRVHFIPNGVGKTFLRPRFELSGESQADLRSKLDLPRNTKIAIFAGRFVEKKGLSHIRLLAQRFPKVLFLLCGTGTIDPSEWGCSNVRVLGQNTATELQELFYACDLLLLPSVGEGFPLVIQEAMACGLPCLILEETWASWGQDRSFFVITRREAVETDFRAYLEDSPAFAFRQRIREFSIATWNWRTAAAQYQKIYDTLLKTEGFQETVAARSDGTLKSGERNR